MSNHLFHPKTPAFASPDGLGALVRRAREASSFVVLSQVIPIAYLVVSFLFLRSYDRGLLVFAVVVVPITFSLLMYRRIYVALYELGVLDDTKYKELGASLIALARDMQCFLNASTAAPPGLPRLEATAEPAFGAPGAIAVEAVFGTRLAALRSRLTRLGISLREPRSLASPRDAETAVMVLFCIGGLLSCGHLTDAVAMARVQAR
ncbi:hypothetical protein EYW49_14110 [Siculibacillus lacustris]|uniref:Uncharacterized protein n=1 Tax=Siculibacillus lacustris TaxID=1549641 RepID=A0A4Q9VLR2_9HYPH|nr:hypothetical protein [Siculibacillus lacustris]TBW36468.1 hypothetical protein EYW49_14110 [Siculibacillus lacustris]